MEKAGLKDERELLRAFYRYMADMLAAKGKRPVGWDEIADAGVNRRSVVMWWSSRSPQILRTALGGGYEAVLVPNDPLYLNFR